MRRSQAPSQLQLRLKVNSETRLDNQGRSLEKHNDADLDTGSQTIQRVPLFGFLEIPNNLHRQYAVPQGCNITKRSIELRKIKVLGTGYNKTPFLKPGGLSSFVPVSGLLPVLATEEDDADDGAEDLPTSFVPVHEPLVLWRDPNYIDVGDGSAAGDGVADDTDAPPKKKQMTVEVIPELACKLRPHQREGVAFLFECTMGLRGFDGEGCILADDMGLGKTLMSITLMWTLLNQGINPAEPTKSACRRAIVACPTSLVGNWDNELKKWIPGGQCVTFPVKSEAKATIRNFLNYKGKHAVLIISYDQQRLNRSMFKPTKLQAMTMGAGGACCDLLICDEAHKLKNAESGIAQSLTALPARKRILLSGTPMQNELGEFFNMVNFCNPGVLGTAAEFRKRYERPILESREPECPRHKKDRAAALQKELSTIVNEFILKRGNILNAQHLPPKLVQVVCCRLTEEQRRMYDTLIGTKDVRHIMQGKQMDSLLYIRHLINICSHPQLVQDTYATKVKAGEKDDLLRDVVDVAERTHASSDSKVAQGRYGQVLPSSTTVRVDPNRSGKLLVLYRMMLTMRALKNGERIVVVSNYTSTLDLIEAMCTQNQWPSARLDGSTPGTKRTKLVEDFNNQGCPGFAFLLSSKAGGCGINLIGGCRLVLFDPDWNPASDKQAAGRIWREGQKRRCFIYRFVSSGSIEEKIIQRQLSKEGLQNIVEDTEQVNEISSRELKALFVRRDDTPSDTHDTIACKRCSTVQSKSTSGNTNSFTPSQVRACITFVDDMHAWLQEQARSIGQVFPPDDMSILRCGLQAPTSSLVSSTSAAALCGTTEEGSSAAGADVTSSSDKAGSNIFASLPQFSKAIRRTMHNIQLEQDSSPVSAAGSANVTETTADDPNAMSALSARQVRLIPVGVHVEEEFTHRWIQFVPELTRLGREDSKLAQQQQCGHSHPAKSKPRGSHQGGGVDAPPAEAAAGEDEEEEEDIGCVEQEGCPEESDLNKWSHHVNVETVDDDVLKRAMVGDDTVSFVFGLEVNWDLLQQKDLEEREAKEVRKEQLQRDLAELNDSRRAKASAKEKKEQEKEAKEKEESASMYMDADTDAGTEARGNTAPASAKIKVAEIREHVSLPPPQLTGIAAQKTNGAALHNQGPNLQPKAPVALSLPGLQGGDQSSDSDIEDSRIMHHSRAGTGTRFGAGAGDSLARLTELADQDKTNAVSAKGTGAYTTKSDSSSSDVSSTAAIPGTGADQARKRTKREPPNLCTFSGKGGTFVKDGDKPTKKRNDAPPLQSPDQAPLTTNIVFEVKKKRPASSSSSSSPTSTSTSTSISTSTSSSDGAAASISATAAPALPSTSVLKHSNTKSSESVVNLIDSPPAAPPSKNNSNTASALKGGEESYRVASSGVMGKENAIPRIAAVRPDAPVAQSSKSSASSANSQDSAGSHSSGVVEVVNEHDNWICFCGFENDPDVFEHMCGVCETKRPRSKRARA